MAGVQALLCTALASPRRRLRGGAARRSPLGARVAAVLRSARGGAARPGRHSPAATRGEAEAADAGASLPQPDDTSLIGLFTASPGSLDTFCEGFVWPQALGEVPPGTPDDWPPAARAALLGRFVRLWPCVRAQLCAGTVSRATEQHASDGTPGSLGLVTRSAGGTAFTPLTWDDVEALGIVTCLRACLCAGGAEARVAVDALFSVLVTQNGGLAERLMVDSGAEAVIYSSLVGAGVHRLLCALVEQPQRFTHSLTAAQEPASRQKRVAERTLCSYLDAKLGVQRAGHWWDSDGAAISVTDDPSAAIFDCLFLLHMCTNWRTGYGVLREHCVMALRSMDLTPQEAAAMQLARTIGNDDGKVGKRPRAGSKRGTRRREQQTPSAPAVHNAYVSMLATCLGVSLPLGGRAAPKFEALPHTARVMASRPLPLDAWRLRQRGVAELVAVAVRNGEFVRSLAMSPVFIPTLVAMATAGPPISMRIQAYAACALYHVAGADMRSIVHSTVTEQADGDEVDNASGSSDSGENSDGMAPGDAPAPSGSSSVAPRPGGAGGGSSTAEVDLDDVFEGKLDPESAAFLLGVFDSQWHARRGDPALVRARLEATLTGGVSRATASQLMAAGAEHALVALLRDCTAATAHARTARGYAAAAMTVLSRIDECRPALVAAGAVAPLIAMLEETDCALDFGAYPKDVLLAGALPHDPAPMSFDGDWVLTPGKPMLAEIAAAALLGLTGRSCLFTGLSSPWDGAPSFAEAMLRGVTAQFGSFGAPVSDDDGSSFASLARATGARRRAHARLLNVLTLDYETANIMVDEGSIPPLVALLNCGSELARQCLAALAVSPDISHRIAEAGGGAALQNYNNDDE